MQTTEQDIHYRSLLCQMRKYEAKKQTNKHKTTSTKMVNAKGKYEIISI